MTEDYGVGFRKPPKHSQFRKGQSGNPKGRPKGSRNFKTDARDMLKAPVPVKENGRTRTVSTQMGALLRLREKALSGDTRALNRLLDLARTYNDDEMAEAAAAALAPSDQAILDGHGERLLRRHHEIESAEQADASLDDTDTPEEDDDAWLR